MPRPRAASLLDRDNISRFGGDPVSVTIVGQSDSRTKIMTLACMERTQGLFSKGVIQSGYIFDTTQQQSQQATHQIVDYLLQHYSVADNPIARICSGPRPP